MNVKTDEGKNHPQLHATEMSENHKHDQSVTLEDIRVKTRMFRSL